MTLRHWAILGLATILLSLASALAVLNHADPDLRSEAIPPPAAATATPSPEQPELIGEGSFRVPRFMPASAPILPDALETAGADAAEGRVDGRDFVLGVVLEGEARAYPINMLSDPTAEILNDELGGRPILLTWCDRCQSAAVYDRRVEGRPLTFFITGALWRENMVMQDVETGSLWLQITGQAQTGPLEGRQLEALPGVLTDWATWRAKYPSTTVLARSRATDRYVHHPDYAGFPGERSYFDAQVLGATPAGGPPRAWPLAGLRHVPVVNDELGGEPVLVAFDPTRSTARLFRRVVDGQERRFRRDGDALVDDGTGSRWDPLTGVATSGPLAGRRLPPIAATVARAESWRALFPDSQYWDPRAPRDGAGRGPDGGG